MSEHGRAVIVVDDDASLRRSVKNLLRSVGFRVGTFVSAEEFLSSMPRESTGCLVLDLQMPGMSGVEVLSHLAAEGSSLPVIILTAHSDDETREQCLRAGAVAFLGKPFRADALLEAVRAALHHGGHRVDVGGARRESTEMSLQMTVNPKPTISMDRERRADRDRDLVAALRRGEPTAAERLVAAYGDRAYRLATSITGHAQDAEEVVQDAFWAVIRKIDTFRGDSAFGTWLYRIVTNAAYQKLRGWRGRDRDLSLDEVLPSFDARGRHAGPMADWSACVDDHSVQTELRMALTSAINELPPASRTMLVLRDVEGLSNLEIADVLGLSAPIVKSRVHRARLFVRKQLGDVMTTSQATAVTS